MQTIFNSIIFSMPNDKRPKFQKSMHIKDRPQPEVDSTPNYPERRLWVSIILFAIQEYQDTLALIQKQWTSSKAPVSKYYLQCIRSMRHELRHEWFNHICDLADVSQHQVLRKIKEFDFKYGLAEVEFTDEDTMVTRHHMRRMARLNERRGMKIHKNSRNG